MCRNKSEGCIFTGAVRFGGRHFFILKILNLYKEYYIVKKIYNSPKINIRVYFRNDVLLLSRDFNIGEWDEQDDLRKKLDIRW